MKKYLPILFLTIQFSIMSCISLYASNPPLPTTVTEYSNGVFDFDVKESQNQLKDFGCFYILPDGTPRWSCDFMHKFSLPINNSVSQWQLSKTSIPPHVRMIPVVSGNPQSNISLNPQSNIPSNYQKNPQLSIKGAMSLSPSWNVYVPSTSVEPSYVIMTLAIENDFCFTPIDGTIEIQTPSGVSIANNQLSRLTGNQQGYYIPTSWNSNIHVTSISTNNNFQNRQQIHIEFSGLAPKNQRFIYLIAEINPLVQVGTPMDWQSILETGDPCPIIEEDNTKMFVQQYPWDPNTKTTSKPIMSPDAPSEEIVYKIDFKNEGEYFAKDVFIVDELTSEYDLSSFQFIDSSHPCPEVIMADNKVYFLFKNIQLPGTKQQSPNHYASSDCDGWLRFSINTQGDHPKGNQIENDAEIFFTAEVNPPIPSFPKLFSTITNYNVNGCGLSSMLISQHAGKPLLILEDFFTQEANELPTAMGNPFLTELDNFVFNNPCTVVLEPVITPQAQTDFKSLENLYGEGLVQPILGTQYQLLMGGGIPIYYHPQSDFYTTTHSPVGYTNEATNSCTLFPTIISADSINNQGFGSMKSSVNVGEAEIYPNPMRNFINIKMSNDFLQNANNFQIHLFDVSGRKRLEKSSQNLQKNQNTYSMEIDASIEKGIYLLQVVTNEGVLLTKKLLKN